MAAVQIITIDKDSLQTMMRDEFRGIVESVKPQFFIEDAVFTMEEAAGFLKCSKSTIQNMISKGEIVPHRPGSHPRFLKSELFDFVRNS